MATYAVLKSVCATLKRVLLCFLREITGYGNWKKQRKQLELDLRHQPTNSLGQLQRTPRPQQGNKPGANMATDLSGLTAEVTRNTEVDDSAVALINGLATQIEQLKTDPVALQALADSMRASSDKLAAAVAANTPAAP
jgi:hypothetical protein